MYGNVSIAKCQLIYEYLCHLNCCSCINTEIKGVSRAQQEQELVSKCHPKPQFACSQK